MTVSRTAVARVVFLVLVWVVVFPPKAMAYLDPGTGSLIFQSVIAALAAAGFALKLYWRRIALWLKPSKRADSLPE